MASEDTSNTTTKKGRRNNQCSRLAKLDNGEKLEISFYESRGVGDFQEEWSRHLGRLVRDRNICPLAIDSWTNFSKDRFDHIWDAAKEKFKGNELVDNRETTLAHMKELWMKWRSKMYCNHVKGKPVSLALKSKPEHVHPDDWEWLIKRYWSKSSFKEASRRNSVNRSKVTMPHHSGSKPFRAIKWDKGGKEGNPPGLVEMFFHTRKKGEVIVEKASQDKYEKLQEVSRSNPSISDITLIETCFGNQRKNAVITYGGAVKPRHLKRGESSSSRQVELESRLSEAERENFILKRRIESLESTQQENEGLKQRMDALEAALFGNTNRQNRSSKSNNSLPPFPDQSSEVQSPIIVANNEVEVTKKKKKKKRLKRYREEKSMDMRNLDEDLGEEAAVGG